MEGFEEDVSGPQHHNFCRVNVGLRALMTTDPTCASTFVATWFKEKGGLHEPPPLACGEFVT